MMSRYRRHKGPLSQSSTFSHLLERRCQISGYGFLLSDIHVISTQFNSKILQVGMGQLCASAELCHRNPTVCLVYSSVFQSSLFWATLQLRSCVIWQQSLHKIINPHLFFQWNSGRVIQLGWSGSEDLLCVQDDGSVLVYDIFGTFKRTFSMGQVTGTITGKQAKC